MAKKYEDYSVLMSVYGKEKPEFLRESMQSVYDQTVPTNDFVLICDGPLTDELDSVISEMQKKFGKRLRVIRQKKNMGLGYSLNHGVKECKNDLIARMDSDDISVRDRIEKQFIAFEKKGADVVGGNIVEYDEKMKKITGRRIVPEHHDDIVKRMKKRNAMNHVTVMYKKGAVIDAGSYVDMPGFEDYYLWIRMIRGNKSFYNVQHSLVKVRCGSGMICRRGGLDYIKNVKKFEKVLYESGFISRGRYFLNTSERIFVSIIPNSVRTVIYGKLLRK
ncbi:glycosyltransferase [Candidatus Saccharibacteria bacterium]|nr:glycosyltransferase [Candidatus Saccharibacteria bacterium]